MAYSRKQMSPLESYWKRMTCQAGFFMFPGKFLELCVGIPYFLTFSFHWYIIPDGLLDPGVVLCFNWQITYLRKIWLTQCLVHLSTASSIACNEDLGGFYNLEVVTMTQHSIPSSSCSRCSQLLSTENFWNCDPISNCRSFTIPLLPYFSNPWSWSKVLTQWTRTFKNHDKVLGLSEQWQSLCWLW